MRLTKETILKARADAIKTRKRVELLDSDCPGLRFVATPTGLLGWTITFINDSGKYQTVPFNIHPADDCSLARAKGWQLRSAVKYGPTSVKPGTFGEVLLYYISERWNLNQMDWRTANDLQRMFSKFLSRPMSGLGIAELQEHIYAIGTRGMEKTVRSLRHVIAWSAAMGHSSLDQTRLSVPVQIEYGKKILTSGELIALLPVLRRSEIPVASALLFVLLTVGSPKEVMRARWSEFELNLARWHIPSGNKRPYKKIPLSRHAMDVLRSQYQRNPTGVVFGNANLDRHVTLIQKASNTSNWTPYDLRSTSAHLLRHFVTDDRTSDLAVANGVTYRHLREKYGDFHYMEDLAGAVEKLADYIGSLLH